MHARFRIDIQSMLLGKPSNPVMSTIPYPVPSSAPHAPTTTAELKALIAGEMARHGHDCSLNHIDVGYITDFRRLFEKSDFNGDISQWNVRRGRHFARMFEGSAFNSDISNWDTSEASDMELMFASSRFCQDVSRWNVSNVSNASGMFAYSPFNADVSQWTFAPNISEHEAKGLSGFVTHTDPSARKDLKLPLLSTECVRLFVNSAATMSGWLAECLAAGNMSRYHWDALLRDPQAYWAPSEMRQFAQTYLSLTPDLGESCIEHSALCMQMWADAHDVRAQNIHPVTLPELDGDAP